MAHPNIDTPLRGSGQARDTWKIGWTYASGAPVFDKTRSDIDPTFSSTLIITDTATGVVTLRFPKCRDAQVLSKNLDPGSTVGNVCIDYVTALTPTSGSAVVRFVNPNTLGSFSDPADGSKYQLILLLDR